MSKGCLQRLLLSTLIGQPQGRSESVATVLRMKPHPPMPARVCWRNIPCKLVAAFLSIHSCRVAGSQLQTVYGHILTGKTRLSIYSYNSSQCKRGTAKGRIIRKGVFILWDIQVFTGTDMSEKQWSLENTYLIKSPD